MSDEDVRQAERRWKETSSDEDAALLLEALARDGFRLGRPMLETMARSARLVAVYAQGRDPRSVQDWLGRDVDDREILALLGLAPSRRRRCQSVHDPEPESWLRAAMPPGAWQCDQEDDHMGDHRSGHVAWQHAGSGPGPARARFLEEVR